MKKFKLDKTAIRPIVSGYGSCMATDRITVDGLPIGYMYREVPDHAQDSGWRFFEGSELPDYLGDAANIEIYDVNTIANYDQSIVPFLNADVGTAYARTPEGFVAEAVVGEDE